MGKKRVVSCAELVLDVETKTQRVILKKKVCLYSFSAIYLPVSPFLVYSYKVLTFLFVCLGAWKALPTLADDRNRNALS